MREYPTRIREVLPTVATTANARERAFVIVFGSPFFCARKHCLDHYVVVFIAVALKDDFFLKMVPNIEHSYMRKKIACVVIRFSIATVVTMVITTIT